MSLCSIPEKLPGGAAHHIIPDGAFTGGTEATQDAIAELREIMQRAGIDINEPANGVILPHTKANKASFDLAYGDGMGPAHLPIHNEIYFTKLRDRMEAAENAGEDIRDALQKCAVDIMDETFP